MARWQDAPEVNAAPRWQSAPEVQAEPDAGGISWDMPEADIRAAIRVLPEKQRSAMMKEWAKHRVGKEREANAGSQTARDIGRNLIRGTPIGSWLDEGTAGAKALAGGDYDEEVALERARNEAADTSASKVGTLPLIGDVSTAGLTKLAGGIISAPLAPIARVAQGATLLPRIINSALSGAGYGALYGAGEGETTDERLKGAGVGAAVGGGVGAAAPPIASAIGNSYGALRNALTRNPAALQQYEPGAVARLARAAGDDDLAARYAAEEQRLGREAMLADMGENLKGQAGAIANQPGRGQRILTEALEGRREGDAVSPGATERIAADLNQALGMPVNVPQMTQNVRLQANRAAEPLYDQFHNTPIQPTGRLGELMERARAAGAYDGAERLMRIEGLDPNLPQNTGRFVDLVKRAVDDLADAAPPRSNLQRLYSNLAREIRDEVDTALSPNNPAMSSWAQARRASGDGMRFEESVEMGQGAFKKSLTPDQMDMDLQGLAPPHQQTYRMGARDAARTVMGNAGTAFGPNGDTAARKLLQTEFGAEKLRRIARSPRDADRLANRLDRETVYAETEQDVLRNSATARRQAAQKEFPGAVDPAERGRNIGSRSATGMVIEGAYRIGNMLTGGALNERRARIAENAAEMLVAQGADRYAIAQGLIQYAQRRNVSRAQAEAITSFAERLIGSARQAAAGGPLEVTIHPNGDPRNNQ